MRVRYSPSASHDLEEIYSTIAANNQPAALRVLSRIRAMIQLIAEHPGMGRASEIPDVQKLSVPGLPYKIIYEPDKLAGQVVILRVYHGSRNVPY